MKHYYAIGDIHGDYKVVRDFYQRQMQLHTDIANGDENVLICLGDFGGNYFFNHRDEGFKTKLGKYNFTYFVIRGNHEERPSIAMNKYPHLWHIEECFGNLVYVENKFPYIKYASDIPCVYNIAGAKTLVIPGAYSIDKMYRLANDWGWFPSEQLTNEEMDIGLKLIEDHDYKFDLVLSHTCPIMFEPTDLFLTFIDQSTVDKTMERYLGNIEFLVDYKLWMWGHYHADRLYPETYDGQRIMLFHQAVSLDQWLENREMITLGEFV